MASGVPYTIIRSTQFLEFLSMPASPLQVADGNVLQDFARPVPALSRRTTLLLSSAEAALAAPRSGIIEIAGTW